MTDRQGSSSFQKTSSGSVSEWSPMAWRAKLAPGASDPASIFASPYGTGAIQGEVDAVAERLGSLPPLVTSFEVEKLKGLLAEAEAGKRFLLWGGDCAETLNDCRPDVITSKLKILLQMSLVLVYAGKQPVIRVGRLAGQYAKPRSSVTETRTVDGQTLSLPSYMGDLINRADFSERARKPDPGLMLEGYKHAALTINFVRSLLHAGFADIHHPEYWDLGFLHKAALTPEVRAEYQRLTDRLRDGVRFMEAVGERGFEQLSAVDFYTSHEALNLWYEASLTRKVPRREGFYNLSTHLPWLGERTRKLGGAHMEYFRGIANPVGVKIGPSTSASELQETMRTLSPQGSAGKLVLIARLGASKVRSALPGLIAAAKDSGVRALWVCDPMHGNSMTTKSGRKTRSFDDIAKEMEESIEIHEREGSRLGGVHIELTGQDVTECVGGAMGLTEDDLDRNYDTLCDPRLNYEQSLELAFKLARRLGGGR